jgi:release factor glutamine methyltransferase
MFAPMTLQEATYIVLNQLRSIYPEGEASQMTDWLLEHITGSAKAERMVYKNEEITPEEETLVKEYTNRLVNHEPIQYVLNQSWFCGYRFYVDRNVLIPRPETEELVEWIISSCKFPVDELKVLDIGSGSGCIAISLKRRIRKAEVWACDISKEALNVAKKNAAALDAPVNFLQFDILNKKNWEQMPAFDIIVSNPPYVPVNNKATMQKNVLDHEPHAALFVPDTDPLVFYCAIAEFGKEHLNRPGNIFCEIHENFGKSTLDIFTAQGYTSILKKDMQQKDRMIRSGLP